MARENRAEPEIVFLSGSDSESPPPPPRARPNPSRLQVARSPLSPISPINSSPRQPVPQKRRQRRQDPSVAQASLEGEPRDHPIAGGTARLFHRDGRPLGTATIRQGGGFLDPQTRQMRVFLAVSDPAEGVLAGDFLRVVLDGRRIANTLTLPETALTRAGYIWLVDADDLLTRLSPEILFRSEGRITISAPQDLPAPWRVVRTPLASFLPGQRVTPQRVEG